MNQLQLPCLGVPFKLGMLYDCRTNKLIPDKTLWSHETLCKYSSTTAQESSRFELVNEDTFSHKSLHLGADANLQLSLLSGLVNAKGAARFFYDRKTSKNTSRVTLSYKSTTSFEQLTIDPLRTAEISEVFKEDMATHVVTGVVYGADAFFVFDQKNYDAKTAQSNIELKIRKHISLDDTSIDCSATEDEGDEGQLTCTYYGDAALPRCPATFQEAIEVCQELPNFFRGRTAAKKVQLLPLSDLGISCQRFVSNASSPIIQNIKDLFESMNDVEVSTNDMIQREACLCFTGIIKELNRLKRLVNAYTLSVKGKIATLLPQIRAGEVPMAKLEDAIKHTRLSPFCQKSLSSLIHEKEQEITYLEQFLIFFKQQGFVHLAFTDEDLAAIFGLNDARFVVCFDFNIHWDNHDFLNKMEAYLKGEKAIKKKTNPPWYTGHAIGTVQNQIHMFASHIEANRYRQGMKYVVTNGLSKLAKQATDKVAIISFYQDLASEPTLFDPLGPPGKPSAKDITSDSVRIIWEAPKYGLATITSYTVKYSFEPDNWLKAKLFQKGCDLQLDVTHMVIFGLSPNTTYHFKVQAEYAHGSSPYSLLSDSITTKPPVVAKEKYLKQCKVLKEGSPKVYNLPSYPTFQSELIEKRDVFEARSSVVAAAVPQKVVMLVGATGSGKTTLINAMANYILGVEWEDDYRFKLITEKTSDDQTKSQTKLITAYAFHKEEGFPFPYSLTVIDTPGFGDTEGFERDKEISAQIKEFFCTKDGIDQLHAVGFVVQSSQARLTPTQKYVLSAILSIFGKDIAENIFLMTTFADGEDPQVLDAIKQAEVPFERYFEFNNSALYANKSRRRKFNVIFWDMGIESFQCFFHTVHSLEPRSLQLTQEVLTERQHLEVCLEGLMPQIQAGLNEKSKLEKTKLEINQKEAEMRANKDFSIIVSVVKQREVPLEGGLFTTTCMQCNYTCHLHCTISDDDKKHRCASMTWFTRKKNTTCRVCPRKCSWTVHKNKPFRYEFFEGEETQNCKEILDRYKVAESSKNELEDLIKKLNKRITEIDDIIEQLLQQARQSLCRLQEIALRPNPMSQEEYIEMLIEAEKQECKPGWQYRVKGLEDAKKKASMLMKVEKGDLDFFYAGQTRPMDDPRGSIGST